MATHQHLLVVHDGQKHCVLLLRCPVSLSTPKASVHVSPAVVVVSVAVWLQLPPCLLGCCVRLPALLLSGQQSTRRVLLGLHMGRHRQSCDAAHPEPKEQVAHAKGTGVACSSHPLRLRMLLMMMFTCSPATVGSLNKAWGTFSTVSSLQHGNVTLCCDCFPRTAASDLLA